jgi:hypothetical protein
MTIQAVKQFTPGWWTPPGQDDDDTKTRFMLQGLDGYGQAVVSEYCSIDADGELQITGEGLRKILELGLIDWENLPGDAGESVPFPGPGLPAQRRLSLALQTAIAAQVFALTHPSVEDKKKS